MLIAPFGHVQNRLSKGCADKAGTTLDCQAWGPPCGTAAAAAVAAAVCVCVLL
jgi:hypothetical protein